MRPWEDAYALAKQLMSRLNTTEAESQQLITRREGRKAGWRVTVVRLSDAMTATAFLRDKES